MIRDVVRTEIRAEMAVQLAPLIDVVNRLKAENKKTTTASGTCKCQDPEAMKRLVTMYQNCERILPNYLPAMRLNNLRIIVGAGKPRIMQGPCCPLIKMNMWKKW